MIWNLHLYNDTLLKFFFSFLRSLVMSRCRERKRKREEKEDTREISSWNSQKERKSIWKIRKISEERSFDRMYGILRCFGLTDSSFTSVWFHRSGNASVNLSLLKCFRSVCLNENWNLVYEIDRLDQLRLKISRHIKFEILIYISVRLKLKFDDSSLIQIQIESSVGKLKSWSWGLFKKEI